MKETADVPHRPTDVQELAALVRRTVRLVPRGGGSKPALSTAVGATVVDTRGLAGVVEYQPAEFTCTVRAGTSVAEVVAMLADKGQYLPFDPPLAEAGATLGGTVASGLAGPGRVRHGGVRDFLLAVAWVDGLGELRRGGAPVVKNAAGFDLPKLMVGSLGRLGILTELSFKVFPQPASYLTARFDFTDLEAARRALVECNGRPFEFEGLELQPPATLWLRLGGPTASLPQRLRHLASVLGEPTEVLEGDGEASLWKSFRHFSWVPQGAALVKVPLTAGRLQAVDAVAVDVGAARCYSAGGAIGWIALPTSKLEQLHRGLGALRLAALVLRAESPYGPLLGHRTGALFLERLRGVLDPEQRFLPFNLGAPRAASSSPR